MEYDVGKPSDGHRSWRPTPPAAALPAAPSSGRLCEGAAGSDDAMSTSVTTCWTVIRGAAAGSPAEREELARRYLGVVRGYLAARWRGAAVQEHLDDATQEVFVECFRQGGALQAAADGRVPSFRAFLYGVVRNVARRFESRPARAVGPLPEVAADGASLSQLFERSWARAIMTEAAQLQRREASGRG